MVDRAMFGDLGDGTFGFRCSRPTFDVKTATRGQLLFDTSAIVFQKVLSGDTSIVAGPSGIDGGGTISANGPPLPSEYASYSNLHMWANCYLPNGVDRMSSNPNRGYVDCTTLLNVTFTYGVENGVTKFTISAPVTTILGEVRSSWAVFNALLS